MLDRKSAALCKEVIEELQRAQYALENAQGAITALIRGGNRGLMEEVGSLGNLAKEAQLKRSKLIDWISWINHNIICEQCRNPVDG